MSTYPAKNRKHPGRQFIVLARLLRAGEEVPLVLGSGRGRELDLIKGMLREGRPLRIACESVEDARSIKQSLGRWRTLYRNLSPLLERLRVQDTDGGTVVLAYFLSPLINPSTGEEHKPHRRQHPAWKRPSVGDMAVEKWAAEKLEREEEIDYEEDSPRA